MKLTDIRFPAFSGLRCLMMPYIQGDPASVPAVYASYAEILSSVYLARGEIGFLTIDESRVSKDTPHRGTRAKHGRALHTEAGKLPEIYGWGSSGWGTSWGGRYAVTLDEDVQVLLANNLDDSCAIWDARHADTTVDGDIGHLAHRYPYEDAVLMKAGEVHRIGILTPHESLPAPHDFDRQFLRIVSAGVHGREEYFTENPLMAGAIFG